MIQTSPATDALLESQHFAALPWVSLQGLGNYEGNVLSGSDRIVSVQITASIDQPVMTATIGLTEGEGLNSLSPFLAGSGFNSGGIPLLRPNASIQVGFIITDGRPGTNLEAGETVIVFRGRVDRVAVRPDGVVELRCRDMGGWLQNARITNTYAFGSDAGTEAWETMLAIDSVYGLTYTPTIIREADPDWMILKYPQQPMSILEADRILAQQAGRDVRWLARNGNALTYYTPRRTGLQDLVISNRRYESITALEWGDEDVRNHWTIQWQNADSSFPDPYVTFDQPSIDLYGHRPSRVFLNRADNIHDLARATIFGDSALADNKDPFATHAISMPIEPRVELNDLHAYLANFRHYDTDLTFAVGAFSHTWTKGDKGSGGTTRTTIGGRPKAIAAYRDYRRSVAPMAYASTFAPPAGLDAPEGSMFCTTASLAFP